MPLREHLLAGASMVLAGKDNRGRVLSGPARGANLKALDGSRPSFWLGTYERHVVDVMKRFLDPSMISYDVGAHIGNLTLVQSKLVGSKGRVVAFEPDPRNLSVLERNLAVNKIQNVEVVPKIVTSESGLRLRFATFDYSFVNRIALEKERQDATLIEVETISLDGFVFGSGNLPPGFIKIDVEGAEDSVLEGAERVIRTYRPIIVAEMRRETYGKVAGWLIKGLGYHPTPLRGGVSDWDRFGLADILLDPQTQRQKTEETSVSITGKL